MIEKLSALLLALVLSLGAFTTVAYAQNATNATSPTATDIQIQLVPNIQRGHNQHVTLYAVDDDGNEVGNESISAEITNEAGRNVGLGQFNTTTGEDQTYKVGPNTRPQNITIDAQLSYDPNVTDSEQYSVFAKPKPPVENVTEPVSNVTEPVDDGNVTEPVNGNVTEPVSNATTVFEQLDNSTAVLEQEIEAVDNDGNETDRANMKAAISETADGIGGVADRIVNATNEQLQTIQAGANAITDAIDLLLD